MDLVFWHNIISPHQASVMRALADSGRHNVVIVSTEPMDVDRRKLGWQIPSVGAARVIVGPDANDVVKIVETSEATAIHVLAGARGTPLAKQVAISCKLLDRRIGMITEAPDPRGIGGGMRWLKYSAERWGLGRRFDFIAAMGQKGVRWFNMCGYPSSRVFPFIYATERFPVALANQEPGDVRFLFVGRLVTLKGVDLLVKALARVPASRLSIIGDGPESQNLRDLAMKYGVEHRITWVGQLHADQVQKEISKADVLVLPSRQDGWGAVVNEALMAGLPVICSTACGASELIHKEWLGTVFRGNKVRDLTQALSLWTSRGTPSRARRERIRSWSRCIEGGPVSEYFEAILRHIYSGGPRPHPPWRN